MATESFYSGASYPMDSSEQGELFTGYKMSPSKIGFSTDPRTAHQIKTVSDKLNTGAKVIELSAVSPETFDAIPKQHLEEINKLRRLTGSEITLHGPVLDPTGFQGRQGWDEADRLGVERQMWSAVERGHTLSPKGNVVVTFHSSNQLPDPEAKFIDSSGKEKITDVWTVDDKGNFSRLEIKKDPFTDKIPTIKEVINSQNKEAWSHSLSQISFHAHNGAELIRDSLEVRKEIAKNLSPEVLKEFGTEKMEKLYALYSSGEREELLKNLDALEPGISKDFNKIMSRVTHGNAYVKDAYFAMKEMFTRAYNTAVEEGNKENQKKLDSLKKEIASKITDLEKPENVYEFAETVEKSVGVLNSITPPEFIKPLRKFAVDKSSETFANIALKSYKEFKDSAPIISVENPPAGMGMSRADDLKQIVQASRDKFIQKAVLSSDKGGLGMSEEKAKEQAEKIIGATWDVGHINMIRKFGYDTEKLKQETKTIAPFVKHVHLSDNFGMEHTELPMGMGNVPIKEELEIMKKYNKQMDKIKMIAETANWFSQEQRATPAGKLFQAFGASDYGMGVSGGYASGFGKMLPEGHFNMYGAGFSNLPPELGGELGGRSRVSGTPMD